MERVTTILTHKEQALFRTIVFRRMPTHGASLTGKVGVHFDRHTLMQKGFIGKHTMQLCKRPLRLAGVGLTLLVRCTFAFASLGALSNVRQVLQANERMRIVLNNPLTHDMIGVLLQPSLSLAYCYKSPCRRASAFVLKTLSQPCIMIGLGTICLPEEKVHSPFVLLATAR